MNKRMTGILAIWFCVLSVSAQLTWERTVLASSGSISTSGPLSLQFTLGEAVTGYLKPGATLLTTNIGFQQGDLVLTGIEDWSTTTLPRVYPNPFHHSLTIEAESACHGRIHLIDALGKTIYLQEVTGPTSTTIQLTDLPTGSYILYWLDLPSGETSSLILINQ